MADILLIVSIALFFWLVCAAFMSALLDRKGFSEHGRLACMILGPIGLLILLFTAPVTHRRRRKGTDHSARNNTGKTRVFRCLACRQKIRVPIPIPKPNIICSKCDSRYRIEADKYDNLIIFPKAGVADKSDSMPDKKSSLEILGLKGNPTLSEIKTARDKKLKEYHPDKVSRAGPEIRALAELRTKQINAGYDLLVKSHKNR